MHTNNDNLNNLGVHQNQNNFNGNIGMSSMAGGSGVAPPLPPRPNQGAQQINPNIYRYGSYPNNMGFGNQMSNYSPYSSMYSCGPFNSALSPFGGYAFNGLNRFNNSLSNNDNDLVRMAEESSRQAFQSIESIVQAFGSVSMMLESTYYAVHSSFRAVIGVADHFSRLRQHLAQILSTLAIIRTFKWIIRRILHLMRIRPIDSLDHNDERAWSQASTHTLDSNLTGDPTELYSRGRSSWPIVIFFGVIFGTPWLVWRLLSTITGSVKTGIKMSKLSDI